MHIPAPAAIKENHAQLPMGSEEIKSNSMSGTGADNANKVYLSATSRAPVGDFEEDQIQAPWRRIRPRTRPCVCTRGRYVGCTQGSNEPQGSVVFCPVSVPPSYCCSCSPNTLPVTARLSNQKGVGFKTGCAMLRGVAVAHLVLQTAHHAQRRGDNILWYGHRRICWGLV